MKNSVPLKILQITDTHLFKNNDDELFGVKPNVQLKKLVDHLLMLNLTIDRIFLTGDVSQDMSAESYQYAISQLSRLNTLVFWIPGNHDDMKIMSHELNCPRYFQAPAYFKTYDQSFIFLNTKYKDVDSGYFSDEDKDFIEEVMSRSVKNEKVSLVMHHHPIKTGTPLIDKYILENNEVFWEVMDRHPKIKHIICGHVHGDYTLKRNDVTVHASMASCFQFAKGSEKIAIEKTIGCKLYEFNGESVTTTSVTADQ